MKRETFPLTAAQRLHYVLTQEYSQPEVTCLGACLVLMADLDFALLKRCIQMELERYDCLRLRFTAPDENGEARQYIAPCDEAEIPFRDLREQTPAGAVDLMKAWTRKPFERVDAPMAEFVLVALPEGYQGVYLRIDHLCADSCAVIALANDVMELYCHHVFGTPRPSAFFSFREAALKDLEKANDPVKKAKDEVFWMELMQQGEPIYTDIKGPGRLAKSRKRHKNPKLRAADRQMTDCTEGQVSFYLEAEPVRRLLDYCFANGVSMTNLLLMGLRTYLSKQNDGETDIGLRNYVSRRSSKLAKLSGGSRVHCFPCRTRIGPETTFLNGVLLIQTLQNNIYRHVNYDPEKVIKDMQAYYHAPENTIYESVALTYQPLPICLHNENLKGISYRSMWFSNGTAIQPVYLTVMHNSMDYGLEFYIKYQTADYDENDMERLYYYLMKIIFMGVEHPELTVGEIIAAV